MSTAFPIQHLGANIEIYSAPLVRGLIQHVVFDFDGTLSLIRAGWQEIMLSLCVKALERTPTAKDRATLTDICHGFILQLTGRQTIYQMMRLAEEARKHGGTPCDPLDYKWQYLNLLQEKIAHRLVTLKNRELKKIPIELGNQSLCSTS